MVKVRKINKKELTTFAKLIHQGLLVDFPEYTKKVKDYFLKNDLNLISLKKRFNAKRILLWGI